ncbi:unnamed protein product [Phaeothamnion confervicola]
MTNKQAMTGARFSRGQYGFTLMELMIVVVIVGIMSSIAFPAYKAYVDRAKRSEGKAFLMELAGRQERYYFDNNSYAADATELGYATSTPKSDQGNYALTNPVSDGDTGSITTSYVLQINTVDPWHDDTCGEFLTLDSKGAQDSDSGDAVCWSK